MFQTSLRQRSSARSAATLAVISAPFELPADVVRARLGVAAKFSQRHRPVPLMLDHAGCRAIQAHETQAAHDTFGTEMFRQKRLVAQAVLEREQNRFRFQQRRQQSQESLIGGRFESDNYQIARSDFLGGPVNMRFRDPEIPLLAQDSQTEAGG